MKELSELGAQRSRMDAKKRQGSRVRAEWRRWGRSTHYLMVTDREEQTDKTVICRLADILEYISLVGFILASVICTLLFAYHGWY